MVENTIMDAHDEAEQRLAFEAMLEEQLAVPFTTNVLGMSVVVEGLDRNEIEDVVAICRRGPHRQLISLIDLPRPSSPPAGWEWIEAYRCWAHTWR
jgi:hypothetical protein